MEINRYSDINVLVLRENWLGCTGLSAFNACLRLGCQADSISDTDYLPSKYRSFFSRGVAKLIRPLGVREFNEALLKLTLELRPSLFLAVKGQFIYADTLRAMREAGTSLYCFFPDLSFTAFGPHLPEAAKEYDWIFTTKSFGPQDLLKKLGVANSSYLPHAYDPQVHRPRRLNGAEENTYTCDVGFVGKFSPRKAGNLEDLIRLRPNLRLKVWGPHWEKLAINSPLRKHIIFRTATGIEYAKAISGARINLGLLQEAIPGASSGDQITSRTFHIPACGGLLLHQRTLDLLEIFRENESCVCFSDVEELAKKIDDLLADEISCNRIAERGRQVVEQGHSWDHRARYILDYFLEHRS
jgi:glycosyltransferase involved in cell wall biosynthesis